MSESQTIAELVSAIQKKNKTGIVKLGNEVEDVERLSTSIFPLDLALGGGFPRGKVSVIYGPESSGKTNCALLTIASFQKTFSDKPCVLVDIEHSFDSDWAKKLGVQTDKLVVVTPGTAEEAIDLVESFLYTDDLGVIVLDSVAAMIPSNEAESSATKAQPGGNSLLVGKMIRKVTHCLVEQAKRGCFPSPIMINQVRFKVGVMYGNPEIMPGGMALRHSSGMTLRLYGKDVVEKEINAQLPCFKEMSILVKKHKVPVVSDQAEFKMALLPCYGLRPGMVDSWTTLITYLTKFGMLEKQGSHWKFGDETFSTRHEFMESLISVEERYTQVKTELIRLAVENTYAQV